MVDDLGEKRGNISLIINSYDEIFSDFDPRPYHERAISDDFLQECKRAAREKDDNIELLLSVPKKISDVKSEIQIRKRLKEHFYNHLQREKKKIERIKMEGFTWIMLGTIFILTVSWLHTKEFANFIFRVLETMLEPAGWFSFWEGLGKIFIVTKEESSDYRFYKKMAGVKVNFIEY